MPNATRDISIYLRRSPNSQGKGLIPRPSNISNVDRTDIKEGVLLFVYNADSGTFSTVKDYLHKLTDPDTYECRLCGLTYGNLGMKNEWKDFLDDLEIKVEFLHRDEFRESYPKVPYELPAAFIKGRRGISLLISADEINSSRTLQDLEDLVRSKMEI